MNNLFVSNENTVYLMPMQQKPVKVVHDMPCPLNSNIWCEHSKVSYSEMSMTVECKRTGACKYGVRI